MAGDVADAGLLAPDAKALELLRRVRGRLPHPRALREDLHRVAADRLDRVDRLGDAAGGRDVGAEQHVHYANAPWPSRSRSARLGALQEREFRLLFAATTVTTVGDALGGIALVFAVLEFGSATDLGLVLAARRGRTSSSWAEACSRTGCRATSCSSGAAMAQGRAQAVTAALVLSGRATVVSLVPSRPCTASGSGLVIPAEVGLVPQTVSPARLQQANALQGLSRNVVVVLGPAVGGDPRRRGEPRVRARRGRRSFFGLCAVLLSRIRVPRSSATKRRRVLPRAARGLGRVRLADLAVEVRGPLRGRELRLGRRVAVLGPMIARGRARRRRRVGDDPHRVGHRSVVGGLFALRVRPARPLFVSVLAPLAVRASSSPRSRSHHPCGCYRRWASCRIRALAPSRPLVHGLPA